MANGRAALAVKLKTLRKAYGLSHKGLGAAAGVSFRTIQNAEYGLSGGDADSLVALAAFFHMTVDELVKDTPLPPPTAQDLARMCVEKDAEIAKLKAQLAAKPPAPIRTEDLAPEVAELLAIIDRHKHEPHFFASVIKEARAAEKYWPEYLAEVEEERKREKSKA